MDSSTLMTWSASISTPSTDTKPPQDGTLISLKKLTISNSLTILVESEMHMVMLI